MSKASGNCFYELEARLANKEERAKRLARLKSAQFGEEPKVQPKAEAADSSVKIHQKLDSSVISPIASQLNKNDVEKYIKDDKIPQGDDARLLREFEELKRMTAENENLAFLREKLEKTDSKTVTYPLILGFYRIIAGTMREAAETKGGKPSDAKRIIDLEMSISEREKEVFMFKETLAQTNKKLFESENLYENIKKDFDNYKNRANQDMKVRLVKNTEEIMKKILPLIDNYERAFEASKGSGNTEALIEGLKMILSQFASTLDQMGIKKLEPLHEPFNPMYQEALMTEIDDSYPEDTVLEVLNNGYVFNDKLIRAASVKVSKRS